MQPPPKSCPRLRGKWTRTNVSGRKGSDSKMPSCLTVPPQLRLRSAERWLEYGRLATRLLHMCQDIRVNALVGTRSPYSLPFVILPVPARSPFHFIRHRRRSTPNLAASPTGRARLESPAGGDAFWVQYKHGVQCRTPSRSDRFNGVTGVARGPKGRNRNLPWPPGKKVHSPARGSSSRGPLPR